MIALQSRDTVGSDPLYAPVFSTLAALHIAFLIETLLYGVHVALFCVCTAVLVKHRQNLQPVLLVSVILMFALSTVDIAFSFRVLLQDTPLLFDFETNRVFAHTYPKGPILVANNFVADSLLLYRCYVIWDRRKAVFLFFSLFLIADTVLGWIGQGTPIFSLSAKFAPVYYWTVLATNLVLTAATAGRIYWISRISASISRQVALQRRYNMAIAMVVESAAVYSAFLLALVICYGGTPQKRFILGCLVMRSVGIMPTLMIVQVGLSRTIQTGAGRNTELVKTTIDIPDTNARPPTNDSSSDTIV